MKRRFAIGVAAILLAANAAAQAEVKIGFVDRERVFREAAPAKRSLSKLDKEFGSRQAELDKMNKQLTGLQQQLDKDAVTMSDNERRDKERQLANLSRDFQRARREFQEDLNLRRNEELASISERATRVIDQIAADEKFDLIVQDAVFASKRIDITDKVIKALADK